MNERPNNLSTLARRHALAALVGTPLAGATFASRAQTGTQRQATPTQTLGPFYPRSASERPRQIDADLLNVEGDRVLSKGSPLYLTGRATTRSGAPVSNALIEIWQCDANAVYHHPAGGAETDRDPNFQGYGQMQTEADGAFHFRTIKPVPYPGRTPHIHVRVQAASHPAFATQLYLPGHPGNQSDFLYRRMSEAERAAVALKIEPASAPHPLARATREMARVELVIA